MLSLIDGDLVLYRCAASAENESFDIAKARVNDLLDRLLVETKADEYRFFLTGSDNFRKKIYPEYKAHRTQPKPLHLQDLREYAVALLNAEIVDGMEADDALAINQTETSCVISLDKDLLQVPGKHYSWEIVGTSHGKQWVREAKWAEVTPLEGLRHFYTQTLVGDKADNIYGVEGIGPVKAEKILQHCKSEKQMFDTIRELYDNDEHLLMNGRVLWIKRTLEDDWKDRFEQLDRGAD